jgi:hypothetical protein
MPRIQQGDSFFAAKSWNRRHCSRFYPLPRTGIHPIKIKSRSRVSLLKISCSSSCRRGYI